jgi:hypothetical protein
MPCYLRLLGLTSYQLCFVLGRARIMAAEGSSLWRDVNEVMVVIQVCSDAFPPVKAALGLVQQIVERLEVLPFVYPLRHSFHILG